MDLLFSGWDMCWGWWHKTTAKIWKFYRVQAADPSPAMSWSSYGWSKSEMVPVGLPLNISNLTWLMNSSWVQDLLQPGLHPLVLAKRGPLSPLERVDINMKMLPLLPNSTLHGVKAFFLPLTPSHQWGSWGCTMSWEVTQLRQMTPTDPMFHHTEHIQLGEEGKGHICSDDVCLSESLLCVMELCCPGGVWTPPCPGDTWKISLFCFACIHGFCFTC